jgi:hypothetical protein
LKMLQKQHNHRHSNQPRSERRIKGKELQDIDVSGYRAINSDTDTVAITIRSTLYSLIRG